jgi:hypothetical protein
VHNIQVTAKPRTLYSTKRLLSAAIVVPAERPNLTGFGTPHNAVISRALYDVDSART